MRNKIQRISIDHLICFFVFTGIISLVSEFLMTPRTISAICLYILFFLQVYLLGLKQLQINRKLIVVLFFFFLSLFVSALLSEDPLYSFKWIKKDFWVSLALGLGIIVCRKKILLLKTILFSFFMSLFFNNIHFYHKAAIQCKTLDIFSPHFIIDRNYSFILPILISFSLACFWYFKNIYLRIFIFINLIFGTTFMILTGARGGYVSLFIVYFLWTIFLVYLSLKERGYLNLKLITISLLLIAFLLSVFGIATSFHPKVQAALKRGFSPNGRDVIIKTRFPVIFKEHPFFGLGYGRRLYFDFLDKHNVPKIHGHYSAKEKRFVYHSDEGIFIQTIIRQGILGFMVFIVLICLALKFSFKSALSANKLESLISFSIFSCIISSVCFRGLVETIKLTEFVLLVFILVVLGPSYEGSNDFSRKTTS
ncbi:hypothetical protein TH606_05625 [Thermodesulfatator autotrophicus]|uniref:O-antigen ligase-related domain-containing protein n=2 Tax=Thermodesulfatator autotrophicus TaxID=1795632 RepID=A0A177E7J1_9BACT|nr:hypothetical protein TH606_05625 [Thermodesulfatator autotrophicus]